MQLARETTRRVVLPSQTPGLRIGLFGGTFDPPHEAHRAVCLIALKRLGLDRIWWMVTPGNPLKDEQPTPLAERIVAARKLANHPRIDVTGFEATIGTRYTIDTLVYLLPRAPAVRFVWIMGADSLRGFHRWRNWRGIAALLPIAVVDRAGASLAAMSGPAAHALGRYRLPEAAARSLPNRKPPAWVFLHGLKSPLSSTELRRSPVTKTQ